MENGLAPEEIDTAILIGDVEAVRAWLDAGGDVNAKCPYSGPCSWRSHNTPLGSLLIVAARCGKTRIMDLLLKRGADIDATDADGRTAVYELLNYWATYGSLPALKVLLSHGADVNKTKQSGFLVGQTPLMIAISAGPDYVRMLLRAGADPEHRAHDLGRSISTAEEQARSDPYAALGGAICSRRAPRRRVKHVMLCNLTTICSCCALCHRRRARIRGRGSARRLLTPSPAPQNAVPVGPISPIRLRVLGSRSGHDGYPWVRQRCGGRRPWLPLNRGAAR